MVSREIWDKHALMSFSKGQKRTNCTRPLEYKFVTFRVFKIHKANLTSLKLLKIRIRLIHSGFICRTLEITCLQSVPHYFSRVLQ